ncbi:MAG: DUF2341 domain-containing protein [Candidatus Micrarchaeota archaeon]
MKYAIIGSALILIWTGYGYAYSSDWWDTSWGYRQPVILTEQAGFTISDYPVTFLLNHSGLTNSGCSDIRVIISNQSVPFGIRNCNSTHAEIAVKANLTGRGNASLYIYYNNSSQTAPANVTWNDARYNFWDDFNDFDSGTEWKAKWDKIEWWDPGQRGTVPLARVDSTTNITPTNGRLGFYTNQDGRIALVTKQKYDIRLMNISGEYNRSVNYGGGLYIATQQGPNGTYHIALATNNHTEAYIHSNGNLYIDSRRDDVTVTHYSAAKLSDAERIDFLIGLIDNNHGNLTAYEQGIKRVTIPYQHKNADGTDNFNMYIGIGVEWLDQMVGWDYADNVFAYKCYACNGLPEPTVSFGSRETLSSQTGVITENFESYTGLTDPSFAASWYQVANKIVTGPYQWAGNGVWFETSPDKALKVGSNVSDAGGGDYPTKAFISYDMNNTSISLENGKNVTIALNLSMRQYWYANAGGGLLLEWGRTDVNFMTNKTDGYSLQFLCDKAGDKVRLVKTSGRNSSNPNFELLNSTPITCPNSRNFDSWNFKVTFILSESMIKVYLNDSLNMTYAGSILKNGSLGIGTAAFSECGSYCTASGIVRLNATIDDITIFGNGLTPNIPPVVIPNVPPIVNAGPDKIAYAGGTVAFSPNASDSDGTIVLYEWDWTNDSVYDWSNVANGTASHAYPSAGVYYAKIRVTDNASATATDTVKVTVTGITAVIIPVSPIQYTVPWWNQSWNYRIPINVTEIANESLVNYPLEIIVNTRDLISKGKMTANCTDIRFTDSSGRELSYWIKDNCGNESTSILIKSPNMSAKSSAMMYMYYSNPSAPAKSDRNSVMLDDDFSILNTSVWNTETAGGSVYASEGKLIETAGSHSPGATGYSMIGTKKTISSAEVSKIEFKMIAFNYGFYSGGDSTAGYQIFLGGSEAAFFGGMEKNYGCWGQRCPLTGKYEIIFNKTKNTYDVYVDGSAILSGRPTPSSFDFRIRTFAVWHFGNNGGADSSMQLDYFKVENKAKTGPFYTLGATEPRPGLLDVVLESPAHGYIFEDVSSVDLNFRTTGAFTSCSVYLNSSEIWSSAAVSAGPSAVTLTVPVSLENLLKKDYLWKANCSSPGPSVQTAVWNFSIVRPLVSEVLRQVPPTVPTEIELQEYRVVLNSWNSPYSLSMTSSYSGGSSSVSIPATAGEASNYYNLPVYIYYRVLTYPDGHQEIIDEYKFDNHNATSSVNTYCVDSQGGSQCSQYKYFSDHLIPKKNITVSQAGNYTVEIKRIKLSTPTSKRFPTASALSKVDLWTAEKYTQYYYWRAINQATSPTGSTRLCTDITDSEYQTDGLKGRISSVTYWSNSVNPGTGKTACSEIGMKEVSNLNALYSWTELNSNAGSSWANTDNYVFKWLEMLSTPNVPLYALAQTEPGVVKFEVEEVPIVPLYVAPVFLPEIGGNDKDNDGSGGTLTASKTSGSGSGGTGSTPLGAAAGAAALLAVSGAGAYYAGRKAKVKITKDDFSIRSTAYSMLQMQRAQEEAMLKSTYEKRKKEAKDAYEASLRTAAMMAAGNSRGSSSNISKSIQITRKEGNKTITTSFGSAYTPASALASISNRLSAGQTNVSVGYGNNNSQINLVLNKDTRISEAIVLSNVTSGPFYTFRDSYTGKIVNGNFNTDLIPSKDFFRDYLFDSKNLASLALDIFKNGGKDIEYTGSGPLKSGLISYGSLLIGKSTYDEATFKFAKSTLSEVGGAGASAFTGPTGGLIASYTIENWLDYRYDFATGKNYYCNPYYCAQGSQVAQAMFLPRRETLPFFGDFNYPLQNYSAEELFGTSGVCSYLNTIFAKNISETSSMNSLPSRDVSSANDFDSLLARLVP